jgi:hypothetical protein
VTAALSRAQLLARDTKSGDLAYARLLVGAELLASDFYAKPISSKHFSGDALKYLKRAEFNEQEHHQSIAGILSDAGQTAATAADFDFSYPKRSFASKLSIAKLGVTLETVFLGAYLGAVERTGCVHQLARG